MKTEIARPSSLSQIVDFTKSAREIRPCGNQSKSALSGGANLSMSAYAGMTQYDPGEFTFTARAGTELIEIRESLGKHRQCLPFDPPLAASKATIGGTVAAALSGPGRFRFGGVRDFLLAAQLVTASGEVCRAGAAVVKNAAGFDLPKLLVGSLGQLGVITEVTFKVFPTAEETATLLAEFDSADQAMHLVQQLTRSSYDLACLDVDDENRLWVRVAGFGAAIRGRLARIKGELSLDAKELRGQEDVSVWEAAGEFTWVPADCSLIKIPMNPSQCQAMSEAFGEIRRRFSCGCNVLWLAWPESLGAEELSARLDGLGSAALALTGTWASPLLGYTESPFEARLKRALDPEGKFGTRHAS